MPVPLISALPTVPSYDNTNFESLAPAFLSFLKNTFQAEMNAAIAAINSYDYGAAVNANIITGQVAVANGGTGLSTLAAGRIPYGAVASPFGNSANFTYDGNKLNIINDSGAQLRLTDSTGNYTDFRTDSDGNLEIAPSGISRAIGTGVSFTKRITFIGQSLTDLVKFLVPVPTATGQHLIRARGSVASHALASNCVVFETEYLVTRYDSTYGPGDCVIHLLHYTEYEKTGVGGNRAMTTGNLLDLVRTGTELAGSPQELVLQIDLSGEAQARYGQAVIDVISIGTGFRIYEP